MQIILDVGSGNSLGDDPRYVESVVNAIKEVDTGKHEVILKAQLFQDQPPNKPLDPLVFDRLYDYGNEMGYKVTASVFDLPSLKFLLNYEVPFIKIACRPDLYWLIGEVPRKIMVYVSVGSEYKFPVGPYPNAHFMDGNGVPLYPGPLTELECSSNYPAKVEDYTWGKCISDHTVGIELLDRFHPTIWEKHFVLEREPTNPDAGPFAISPTELKEVLC